MANQINKFLAKNYANKIKTYLVVKHAVRLQLFLLAPNHLNILLLRPLLYVYKITTVFVL
ncbi:MAG: hypothetical protein CVU81_03085 [Euryarchaeota archaeon HGW-Euryarchaeota-1]|nr:MAG: hypothetical protein CVU81_03085 [Euryarchaeota archaeon HGW-Euryarchaeota-1]